MFKTWLSLLCQMVPKVRRAVFISAADESAVVCWPNDNIATDDLLAAVKLIGHRGAPIVSVGAVTEDSVPLIIIGRPVLVKRKQVGVVVLEIQMLTSQQPMVQRLLDWGQSWLQWVLQTNGNKSSTNDTTQSIALLKKILPYESVADTSSALATEVADAFGFDRVSVGLLQAKYVRVLGTSHRAGFDIKMHLFQLMEECMAETVANGCLIECPTVEGLKSESHQRLLALDQLEWVFTLPLFVDGTKVIGVLLCEAKKNTNKNKKMIMQQCENIALLAAPVLWGKQQAQRSWWAVLKEQMISKMMGAAGVKSKVLCAVLALCLMFLFFVEGDHRVTARAYLEGHIQRSVVSPEDGYVDSAEFRAGHTVKQGDVLATLDDRQLKLELQRWNNKKEEYQQQYNKELMAMNQIEMGIAKAQMSQANAQIQILQQRLQRVKLLAPIDGVIIKGDLSRSLGAPIERGDVLFEIAPLDHYRLVVMINERDIRYVKTGQLGQLNLTSLTGVDIHFEMEKVATVFEENEGVIEYRSEARLIDDPVKLRPGMTGYSKINVGQRPYFRILFQSTLDWVCIKWWSISW